MFPIDRVDYAVEGLEVAWFSRPWGEQGFKRIDQ